MKTLFRPYLNCFEQDDPFLINELKTKNLKHPSVDPYNWTVEDPEELHYGQFGQPVYLDNVIFKKQVKNGFFIEAGADDFEKDSNSLLFEMKYGWSGLLVEPNPAVYPKGLYRNRKAWAATTCFSTTSKPQTIPFSSGLFEGGMAGIAPEATEETIDMQCFPFYSLLMATAPNTTVNYLSLDIEGAEFQVLQTIPWDKVDIEVLTVETEHAGKVFPGTRKEIIQYLGEQGYVHVTSISVDDVFVRKDLFEGKYAPDMTQHQRLMENMKKYGSFLEPEQDNDGETGQQREEL